MTLDEAIKRCKEKAEELREQIITALDDGREIYDKDCEDCANDHEQLAEWLEELAERREADRWIPVSERLPEPNIAVLTYINTGTTKTYCLANWNEFYQGWEEWIGIKLLRDKHYIVIAWKPLPEPYKENDNGKES